MAIAFLPWPTSICKSICVSEISQDSIFSAAVCNLCHPYSFESENKPIDSSHVLSLVAFFRFDATFVALPDAHRIDTNTQLRKAYFVLGRKSYLTSRNELKRAEGSLQVLGVALKVEKSVGEGGLQLGRALPGGRVGGDFVEGSHDVCVCETKMGYESLLSSSWNLS